MGSDGDRLLLLPALIDSPLQFQLEMFLLAAWWSPDSFLERSVEVRFQGQWRGNSRAGLIGPGVLEGGGSYGWVGFGVNLIPKAREFPPQWPGASPLLASLTLSQEALRLPIITL